MAKEAHSDAAAGSDAATGATRHGDATPTGVPGSAAVDFPRPLLGHPRYRLIDRLGSGGMGAVYRAEHTFMQRTVVLKVIRPELLARPEAVERFRREVRAAARLSHPNVVTAHDADEAQGLHFLVMEYVDGESLAQVVANRGPLPIAEACDYVRQTALGLQHAYERGLMHRDIKPGNLLLTPRGQVKIVDFGLAYLMDEASANALTPSGAILGTPDYIAPEQARNPKDADIRADIYALGCTLYHLLVGQPPFAGGTAMEKLLQHQYEPLPQLDKVRPDVHRALAAVVERMCAKDPEQRFRTAAEVAEALAAWAAGSETIIVPPPSGMSRRRRWPWIAGAAAMLLALLAVGGTTALVWLKGSSSATIEKKSTDGESPSPSPPAPRYATAEQLEEVRSRSRDQARAWVRDNNAFKPDSQFIRDCTRDINRAYATGPFIFTFGDNTMRARRPTLLAVRGDGIFVFPLTDEQAQRGKFGRTLVGFTSYEEMGTRYLPPAIEVSNPIVKDAAELPRDRPVEGSVTLKMRGAWKGEPLHLRIAMPLEKGLQYSIAPRDISKFDGTFSFSVSAIARRGDKPKGVAVPIFFDVIEGAGSSGPVVSNCAACLVFLAAP
jgi:serine/threonine protein kinase